MNFISNNIILLKFWTFLENADNPVFPVHVFLTVKSRGYRTFSQEFQKHFARTGSEENSSVAFKINRPTNIFFLQRFQLTLRKIWNKLYTNLYGQRGIIGHSFLWREAYVCNTQLFSIFRTTLSYVIYIIHS